MTLRWIIVFQRWNCCSTSMSVYLTTRCLATKVHYLNGYFAHFPKERRLITIIRLVHKGEEKKKKKKRQRTPITLRFAPKLLCMNILVTDITHLAPSGFALTVDNKAISTSLKAIVIALHLETTAESRYRGCDAMSTTNNNNKPF